MNRHHQWCLESGKIIEGVCAQCEQLEQRYPSLGHLDYDYSMFLHDYDPDAQYLPSISE